jgi:xylulokinase
MMPFVDPAARGVIAGLRVNHRRADIWRALLESFGWIVMDAQRRLTDRLTWVVAGGMGARSAVWRSIVTDMTGIAQSVGPTDASARGAAFLAALGTGGTDGANVIWENWLAQKGNAPANRPDAAVHARYMELLPDWLALDEAHSCSNAASPAPA